MTCFSRVTSEYASVSCKLLCSARPDLRFSTSLYSVHIQCLKAFDRLSFERRGPLLCSKNTLLRKSAWLYNESIDSITLMQIMFGKCIHRSRFRQRCSSLIGKQGSVCLPTFCKTQWLPSTSYSDGDWKWINDLIQRKWEPSPVMLCSALMISALLATTWLLSIAMWDPGLIKNAGWVKM